MNILRKDFDIFKSHIVWAFIDEQIDSLQFLWDLVYSLLCHSLLKRCFQNGQLVESAWCSPLQLEHLKEWGQGSPFFISSLGGLILLFALQHHANSLWWIDWCEPLHLTHFAPYILQTPAVWPHFQQFLHWGMPGSILVLYMIAMNLPMLNLWLIRDLALEPLWESHISTHMIAMSDFGETFIILSFEAKMTSLKMWVFLRMFLISLEVMYELVASDRYGMLTIFKYDLDWESQEDWTWFVSTQDILLIYFSMAYKSEGEAILLVVTTIPLPSTCM